MTHGYDSGTESCASLCRVGVALQGGLLCAGRVTGDFCTWGVWRYRVAMPDVDAALTPTRLTLLGRG